MSADLMSESPVCSAYVPPAVKLGQLSVATAATAAWLWDGYLAAGKVTLLTSLWKMGKTTLLSVLLARMKAGGELAGRAVRAGGAVVVTEESPDYWVERGRRLALDPDLVFFCQPFRAKPTHAQWLALVERIEAHVAGAGINLVVIDPLATFLPGQDENGAGTMLAALLPLQALTHRGAAVLLLHHPRKQESEPGHAARGSGALAGHADILLELRSYPRAGEADRRRRLCGLSRFAQTPRQVVLELNAEGNDYACLGEVTDEAFEANWEVLLTVLAGADEKLSRGEILERWPVVEVRPNEATLWRWLERAVADGRVQRCGNGYRGRPFQYWLPEAEARWQQRCGDLKRLEPLEDIFPDPYKHLPPLLPPNIRKLVEQSRE
ncbi:MAG: AAA family ATPase [Gemmataceae bacterium]